MHSSERLCLQWNAFKENVTSAFGRLREDNDFSDVTLVSKDGKQVEAHRIVLASSSPFFMELLRNHKRASPLIFIKGVKYEDLVAIVDFLYVGAANVFQENLDSFLAIATPLPKSPYWKKYISNILKDYQGNLLSADRNWS